MTYSLPPQPDRPTIPVPVMPVAPPRRRWPLIIGAVCVVAVIAAVAATLVFAISPKAAKSGAGGQQPIPQVPAATTPSRPTASVQQYASAVSPPIKSLRDTYQQYQANACAVRSADSGGLACSLAPLTFSEESQTLALTLRGSAKPGVPAYIGDPPAEIAKLVEDTTAAAEVVTDASSAQPVDQGTLFAALSNLMSTLDRWDPYM